MCLKKKCYLNAKTFFQISSKVLHLTVLSPTVKSREFYLHDDVTFPAKWLTFVEKNLGVKFVLVTSSLER